MMSNNTCIVACLSVLLAGLSCNNREKEREEDKIFHAGPASSGFSSMYFGLYKDHRYQFCDGDFLDYGCYSGKYGLSGDTLILYKLKKHDGIPTGRFLIRRYRDMDSNYWQWKYPDHRNDWESMRHSDSVSGSTGDVFPLNQTGEILREKSNYFLIRLDQLKASR